MACEIFVPPTRDWTWSPTRKALNPNHQTTREFSFCPSTFFKKPLFFKCLQLKIISFPKWYIREWLILPPIYMFYKLKGKCGEPNFLRLSILKPPCSQFGFHSINFISSKVLWIFFWQQLCLLSWCPTLWDPLDPARLLCPWNIPDKNTGVCFLFLLQGISPTQGSNQSLLPLLHCRWLLYHLSHLESPFDNS